MTNTISYGLENRIPTLFLYQIVKQTVSSPISFYQLVHNLFTPEQLSSVHVIKKSNNFITPREQLLLISAFFGFSKSKLGEIFGVSRQSIHSWFNNAEVASENYEKIKRLADIVIEVDPNPSQQIFHVYANDVIEGYNKSLFEYILDDDSERESVIKLAKTIYEMSRERWKRISAMPKAKFGTTGLLEP